MRLFFVLFLCCSYQTVYSQIFKNILLDSSTTGRPPCEPTIAINPTDVNNIVAGSILDKVYYTFDGGKKWNTQRLTSTYGVWGDPVIVADPKGNFYFFHLSDPTGKNWKSEEILDRIVCQKSTDKGLTWNNGSYMGSHHPKDQDKEWAAVDPYNQNLYVTWTQFDKYGSKKPEDRSNILLSKSVDGGMNWSETITINQKSGNCLDDSRTVEGAVPSIGPNSEVYVAWSYDNIIYFDRSFDQGKTWLDEDIEAIQQPGGWDITIPGINRSNGLPVTACDLSERPYKGTIYINWADQRNGKNDTDIWLSKSTDNGNTWSSPKRINDDKVKNNKHQFLTWMTIDQKTGYLYFIFYDRRHYTDNQTDVYLAYSTDGGNTFVNKKISEKPFIPDKEVFFGDYSQIVAHNGLICPIWARMDDSNTSVWTAIIKQKQLIK